MKFLCARIACGLLKIKEIRVEHYRTDIELCEIRIEGDSRRSIPIVVEDDSLELLTLKIRSWTYLTWASPHRRGELTIIHGEDNDILVCVCEH